jgi:hypothetical protein
MCAHAYKSIVAPVSALHTLESLSLYFADSEIRNGNGMYPSENFLLAKAVMIIIVICSGLLFLKLASADKSSDFSGELKFFQETNDELLLKDSENLSDERRRELLEKIKEERIKEYLYQKKRKFT